MKEYEYTVTLIYDNFKITTVVVSSDEQDATLLLLAISKLVYDENLSLNNPIEYQVELNENVGV